MASTSDLTEATLQSLHAIRSCDPNVILEGVARLSRRQDSE
ncbi:hypothetical protein [Streptomyces sp. bgisy060]